LQPNRPPISLLTKSKKLEKFLRARIIPGRLQSMASPFYFDPNLTRSDHLVLQNIVRDIELAKGNPTVPLRHGGQNGHSMGNGFGGFHDALAINTCKSSKGSTQKSSRAHFYSHQLYFVNFCRLPLPLLNISTSSYRRNLFISFTCTLLWLSRCIHSYIYRRWFPISGYLRIGPFNRGKAPSSK
jgi:hypothetical protein